MFSYKNTSLSVKTFYGVTFKPGEVNDVPGFINDPSMIRVKEKPKASPSKSASVKAPEPAKSTQQESLKPAEKKQNELNKEKEEIEGGEFDNGTSHN